MKSLYQAKSRCKRRRPRLQMLVAVLYSALILAACTTGQAPVSTMPMLNDDLDGESLHMALRRIGLSESNLDSSPLAKFWTRFWLLRNHSTTGTAENAGCEILALGSI